MTPLIHHLAAALTACVALDELGVRVLGVRCSPMLAEPRIHVDDPGNLLDHIDAQSVDTSAVRYAERSVLVDGCRVFWLPAMQSAAAQAHDSQREPWPLPERAS